MSLDGRVFLYIIDHKRNFPMPNSSTHPLIFNCYKCGKESRYPNYLKEGEDKNAVKSVVKRCTTCGAENEVPIPEGWSAERTGSVLRGLKHG